MVDIKPEGYSVSDLADYSENELLKLLKAHWGYDPEKPLDLLGRLKEIPAGKNGYFYVLEQLHSVNDGAELFYPLSGNDVRHTVFVGSLKGTEISEDHPGNQWVKVRVNLSPEDERVKHNNPFALKAINGGIHPLEFLPDEAVNWEYKIDGRPAIEKWVVDYFQEKNRRQILEEDENYRKDLLQQRQIEEQRIGELNAKTGRLGEKLETQSQELTRVSQELRTVQKQRSHEEQEFLHRRKKMEHQLSKLNELLEQKANMLVNLDLVSREDVDSILGRPENRVIVDGHDFKDVFSSDPVKAISYVQAYLYNQGIVYRRSVLEDFYALLTTHDLIVLAGDSGSGKTNLVKSFAEAVGGKAFIVPVKPNWTSAEDLLGYYNPLERKYLSTPFLDALFEASKNPDVPYFICLDEMNLARAEYYFADFLSLLEERRSAPEIHLYSDTEAEHLVSEVRNFLSLIDESKIRLEKQNLISFLDLLRDDHVNAKLHELCGFREGESLLRYHAQLRKLLGSYLTTPSAIQLPTNVRIIGAINVDETTHYLSPKILDRAHILRFGSPLLADWEKVEDEIDEFDLDMDLPLKIDVTVLGSRVPYPDFDRNDKLVVDLLELVRNYLDPLGIEFGLRAVRQARHYRDALQTLGVSEGHVLNNIVLHKVLPKLMFDGEKAVNNDVLRKDILLALKDHLDKKLSGFEIEDEVSCIREFDRVIRNAASNDWVVNYWSR